MRSHFGEIVRQFLFVPYILDRNFLQLCVLDCLHGRERFEKLTSHSVPQELPIVYGVELFIITFRKIIGPWREEYEASPHPSIPDT